MSRTVLNYYETDRPLPAVVIDHPTQLLEPEELPARSMQIVEATLRLLDDMEP